MKYLIIGNGIAGIEAAVNIRKNDPEGDISIVTSSKHAYYYRPRLIDYIAGKTGIEQITIHKKDFYEKNRISVIYNTAVLSVLPREKTVLASGDARHFYDRLLLANGARPFLPEVPGNKLEGVFTLRGVGDCDRISGYCRGIDKAVIIGGGLLGLETACSVKTIVPRVTVVEFAEWLLPRQLDREGGDVLKKLFKQRGVDFFTGAQAARIEESGGRVSGVLLNTGELIKAGAVIFSAGVRPRLELAAEAGLKVSKGIMIDDYMKTSDENIFAAGDIAEHNGILYGLWNAAREQGAAAGLNMAGRAVSYSGSEFSALLKVSGIDLYSAGDIYAEDVSGFVKRGDASYVKILAKGDKLTAAMVLGDTETAKQTKKIMDGHGSPGDLIAGLERI